MLGEHKTLLKKQSDHKPLKPTSTYTIVKEVELWY